MSGYGLFDVRVLIVAFGLAVSLFAFYTHYHKSVLGPFVRALLASGAESAETAKTAEELGVLLKPALVRALLHGALSSVVTVVAREEGSGKERALDTCSFFIARQRREKAQGIYAGEESVFVPVLVTATALVLSLVVYLLFPQIVKLFS